MMWQLPIVWAAIQCAYVASESIEYAPIVQLSAGKVRGVVETVNGQKVHLYQGIRYGEAKRFAKATPVSPWTGIYDAIKFREQCPQPMASDAKGMSFQTNETSENCLYLSIWKPANKSTAKRATMIFIHGGTYMAGSIFSNSVSGKYIAAGGDVILVAIAYRLGAFGLMFTGEGGEIPANLQLLDQIHALKFIKENIHAFGGDPHQITIFGESSGSFNVGQLILSPLATGLFNRAILQSGAPNAPFYGADKPEVGLQKTKAFARLLNCAADSINQTVACLREKPLRDFLPAMLQSLAKFQFFVPVYNNEVLPMSPIEALRSGHFNRHLDSVMYGVNANEGSHFALSLAPEVASPSTKLTKEFAKREIIRTMRLFNQSNGEEIADYYLANLGNRSEQDELRLAIANAMGELVLTCPTILFGEALAQHSPNTHVFSYRLNLHVDMPGAAYQPWEGCKHSEDIIYLFMVPFVNTTEGKRLSSQMITCWTNLAKSKPGQVGSVKWSEAVDRRQSELHTRLMALESEPKMLSNFYAKTCNGFWKSRMTQ